MLCLRLNLVMELERIAVSPGRLTQTCRRLGARLDAEDVNEIELLDIATGLALVAGLLRQRLRVSEATYTLDALRRAYRTISAVEQVCTGAPLMDYAELHGMLHLAQDRLMGTFVLLTANDVAGRPVRNRTRSA
jgi:hypothetical protein